MKIKITSTHKTDSNAPLSDFFVSVNEFYINVKSNIIQLRAKAFTYVDGEADPEEVIEEGGTPTIPQIEVLAKFMKNDPISTCITQELSIKEVESNLDTVTLSGTRYDVQAQLLYELVFDAIDKANEGLETPVITFELIDFPS